MTRLTRFAWLVLGWNVAVILWGAFVRATGSGAGCGAHWPLCNGVVVPQAPAVETMIEYLHRATSGVALLLVLALTLVVFRARGARHPARRAAAAALAFILLEAALGAGLVLFRLVAADESVARALFMALHLVNTLLLLAALGLTAHWCGMQMVPAARPWRGVWPAGLALLALVIASMSGAIAALGDTLYPARSLLGGLAEDLSPTGNALVRLRLAHPILALAATLVAAFAASRALRTSDDEATRRVAWTVPAAALVQLAAGLLNVALLAPVWLQLVHLFLADVLWIAVVLLAVRWREQGPPARSRLTSAA